MAGQVSRSRADDLAKRFIYKLDEEQLWYLAKELANYAHARNFSIVATKLQEQQLALCT